VSRSIKDAAEVEALEGTGVDDGADPGGHDKFLADLGDFADGEQAARAADPAPGSGADEGEGTDGDPK
jgi:hypothetical protein